MASVHPRKNRDGDITSYQVKWRDGGGRQGAWQSETFDDEAAAGVFQQAVDDAGQRWPAGWVKGKGYITSQDQPAAGVGDPGDERYRFRAYARHIIENRTGIEERYRKACLKELESWVFPTFGECDVRSTEHFSSDTIRPWVRQLEQTKVRRGRMPDGSPKMKPMSPKTIRNLHGLLSSVLKEAVQSEPPLRARNPCDLTRLPRIDDDGADDGEDIEFLTPQEVAALRSCFTRRSDQNLVTVKYGTGLRWSELTALAPMCVIEPRGTTPKIRVRRAWKRDGEGKYYLGKPKTKAGRRSVRVSATVIKALEELGLHTLPRGALLFTGDQGQRLHYSTFYDRWARAVAKATKAGLLPPEKHPTPHDLRHSHAAALLSGTGHSRHSLTYVQRRFGHESIKTTSDVYGHLLPEADDDAMETIEAALGGSGKRPPLRVVA